MKPHYPTRTDARTTSPFGWRTHPVTKQKSHHDGIDLAPRVAGTKGVPVYAVADGIVRTREFHSISGNRIFIEHTQDDKTTVYLHLASFNVNRGQSVKRGQQIGVMGETGRVTGIHLHFGVSTRYPVKWNEGGSFINPIDYLNKSFPGIKVDKYWGKQTTKALQKYFGTPVDGELWGQHESNQATKAITGGIKYGKGGSAVIKAFQRHLNTKGYKLVVDGILGKKTIKAIQTYLGTPADGIISHPSVMVGELQKRLNNGTL